MRNSENALPNMLRRPPNSPRRIGSRCCTREVTRSATACLLQPCRQPRRKGRKPADFRKLEYVQQDPTSLLRAGKPAHPLSAVSFVPSAESFILRERSQACTCRLELLVAQPLSRRLLESGVGLTTFVHELPKRLLGFDKLVPRGCCSLFSRPH